MRSRTDLLQASGYGNRPKDFDDLIQILDTEIRLITPTDPEGKDDDKDEGGIMKGEHDGDDADSSFILPPSSFRFYQLTHDYLVPSLRDWLTRKQKETRRGRAELLLADRAALWQTKREARQLPSFWEYMSALWFVPKKQRTAVQQQMLRQAGQFHAIRWGSVGAILLMVGLVFGSVILAERQRSLQSQVATAVDAVQNNRGLAVPVTLKELKKLPDSIVVAELKKRYSTAERHLKLGLAFALAAYDDIDIQYLCSQIHRAAPGEFDNLITAFESSRTASLEAIHTLAEEAEAAGNWRLKARYAVVALHLDDESLASNMCQIHHRPDPIQRTILIDALPGWPGNVATLARHCLTSSDPALQSGLALVIGSIPPEQLADFDRVDAFRALKELYETSPESVVHSSAGWALRQWGVTLPLPSTQLPTNGCQWFVNSLGMTLLKIQPGEFVQKEDHAPQGEERRVKLTRGFFLSDQEVSVEQFQEFIEEKTRPDPESEESKMLRLRVLYGQDSGHPAQHMGWYDAVLFCNWLSRKEGRTACYERTGEKEKVQISYGKRPEFEEFDAWGVVSGANGYRLPTEAEWEYACRAGTTTYFSSGNDDELLRKYAVFLSGKVMRNGSKLPNGWGMFDMHGNVDEWCNDRYGEFVSCDIIDPVGPIDGSDRVYRGGDWSGEAADCRSHIRNADRPSAKNAGPGLRVCLSSGEPI